MRQVIDAAHLAGAALVRDGRRNMGPIERGGSVERLPTLPPLSCRRPCPSHQPMSSGPKGHATSPLPRPPSSENAPPRVAHYWPSGQDPGRSLIRKQNIGTDEGWRQAWWGRLSNLATEGRRRRIVNKLTDSGGISPSCRTLGLAQLALKRGSWTSKSSVKYVRTNERAPSPPCSDPLPTRPRRSC